MPLIRTVCALWYTLHLPLSPCMFMYIYAYMHICLSMYTHTHSYRERGVVCAESYSVSQASLKLCCSGCPEQSYFFRLTSTGITAISFPPPFFPIALFQLELKCHKGNTWRKQVILGYQAVGKCLGKRAFPSVLREGEKLSHCPEKRT